MRFEKVVNILISTSLNLRNVHDNIERFCRFDQLILTRLPVWMSMLCCYR